MIWVKIWARKYSVHKIESALTVLKQSCKIVKSPPPRAISISESASVKAVYFEDKGWTKWGQATVKFFEKKDAIKKHRKDSFAAYKKYVQVSREIGSLNLSKLSNQELAKHFLKFWQTHQDMISYIWYSFPIDTFVGPKVRVNLKKILNLNELNKAMLKIYSPEEMSAITKQRLAILKAALDLKKNPKLIRKKSADLTQRFGFLGIYDFNESLISKETFLETLKEENKKDIPDLKREITEIISSYKKNKSSYKKLLKALISLDSQTLNLIEILHQYSYIKDARDDFRRLGHSFIIGLYKEIAKRLHLSIDDLMWLSFKETMNCLMDKSRVNFEEISKRKKLFVAECIDSSFLIFSGEKAQKKLTEIGLLKDVSEKEEIKGVVACKGNVRGRVVVVPHKGHLKKFKSGYILVTVMTAPDYLPFIKKSKGIITDEGGLTCHAAIVSRELKIPCIVGTKIATKVLRDGDLVEIYANKGLVRLLERRTTRSVSKKQK